MCLPEYCNQLEELHLMEWFYFYYLKHRNILHLFTSQKATFKYLILRNQKRAILLNHNCRRPLVDQWLGLHPRC